MLNDEMADALRRSDSSDFVKAARRSKGYRPLVVSAMMEALDGITSLEEVYRVAEQIDESGDWMDPESDGSEAGGSDEGGPNSTGDTHTIAWNDDN